MQCLRTVLQLESLFPNVKIAASVLLTLGGLGIGSAFRTRDAAHWGRADCLEMVQNKKVEDAADRLRRDGVNTPIREALTPGETPRAEPDRGWQKEASSKVHKNHREKVVWPLLTA